MSASVVAANALPPTSRGVLVLGRAFVHPLFDYLLIGGGLSLVFTAAVAAGLARLEVVALALPLLLLVCNMAHFAASTVRLYAKPGAFQAHRFLTMALPLVTLGLLALAIAFPARLGAHVAALYFTWSPYHYSAQAYGLAVMYCYRSGCPLTGREKAMLRLVCLLPFVVAFLDSPGAGLQWFVTPATIVSHPAWNVTLSGVRIVASMLTLLMPALFMLSLARKGKALPAISLLIVIANGVWWVVLDYMHAFVWATVFHGVQYLAIVVIFHVNERRARPGDTGPWWAHALGFYGVSLALGYALFQVLPLGFLVAGFGWAQSVVLVIAAINIHHFIVDAYIWRLRRDPNYRVVVSAA
jgi:hypothetical protein